MGTNFYWASARCPTGSHATEDSGHIGKRSAAGTYCWDCGVTLCTGGPSKVHHGACPWHEQCPVCGQKANKAALDKTAAGVELGFASQEDIPRTGVSSCCSFNYAQSPDVVQARLAAGEVVVNEYGEKFTPEEFQRIMELCPIKFTESVGTQFS